MDRLNRLSGAPFCHWGLPERICSISMPMPLWNTSHWCISVRLARNEPELEARREGAQDGEQRPCLPQLPLHQRPGPQPPDAVGDLPGQLLRGRTTAGRPGHALSALCRGSSTTGASVTVSTPITALDEKLRVCRELAIAMQADDRAEYGAEDVRAVFAAVLADPARATVLLGHIWHRTSLLIEHRPDVFAFAHLTF